MERHNENPFGLRAPLIRNNQLLNNAIFTIINNINSHNIDDIITESMEKEDEKKPICKDFLSKLDIREVTEEDIENKLSCAICQDLFSINEKIIGLPCKEAPHFFHIKNDEECPGIYPWMDEKNTCPVCRSEFPSEKITEPEPEPEPEPGPGPEQGEESRPEIENIFIPIPLSNIINPQIRIINQQNNMNYMNNRIENIFSEIMETTFQEIEDQEMNEAIRRSLEDNN